MISARIVIFTLFLTSPLPASVPLSCDTPAEEQGGTNMTAPRRTLKPTPTLPIDCAGVGQPCTGSICVAQTRTITCDGGEELVCDNDTQTYGGGNVVCCTDRTTCGSCFVRNRWTAFSNYKGTENRSCVRN
jgi:hypothetical protein